MPLSLRRLFLVIALLALFATSCSSSGDDIIEVSEADSATDTATAGDSTDEAGGDDTGDTDDDPDATSIPVPTDDAAADDAIAGLGEGADPAEEAAPIEPESGAQGFVRNRFNIDPTPEQIDCIVARGTDDAALDTALRSASVELGDIDDTQLRALTFAMNGCLDAISLGDWATQAVGPQGEVLETAPDCFAERFSDADNGDLTFYTFAALTYQFRVDQTGVPSVTDAFVNCTPITGLAGFFANEAEANSGFTVEIDRDCLDAELSDPAASEAFWSTLIEGLTPPITTVTPYLETCETVPPTPVPDTRAAALPADFVAWSGTGALTAIQPQARQNAYDAPPPMTISADGSYEAVMTTGGGEVRIRLFADTAPVTVNNFVNLARDGYYDGTLFHRVIADFMAQGGDPTGTGTGGPGYQFQDEFEGGPALDRKGLLAMANSGPATNGSQFFITFAPTEWLTGAHTVFGEVIEGIEIVDAIEIRDPASGRGGQILESVTIIEN